MPYRLLSLQMFSPIVKVVFVLLMVSLAAHSSILDICPPRKSIREVIHPELFLFLSFQMMDAIKGTMWRKYSDLSRTLPEAQ